MLSIWRFPRPRDGTRWRRLVCGVSACVTVASLLGALPPGCQLEPVNAQRPMADAQGERIGHDPAPFELRRLERDPSRPAPILCHFRVQSTTADGFHATFDHLLLRIART